ncbi:MAG TPA: hypothetical protein DHN29_12965 [Cytophagales bacterium]|nr:hypothetical protein [Cytophagales bacterium]|tara:strand:+ start:1823 stop:2071 length:249 start_codon:yes stop_codon:yes gene_type:complete
MLVPLDTDQYTYIKETNELLKDILGKLRAIVVGNATSVLLLNYLVREKVGSERMNRIDNEILKHIKELCPEQFKEEKDGKDK